jgi:DNA-binding NarL/FixJ family response regulator
MKVLVVADRALIREALRGVLKELRGDITVLEAVDSRQAMEIVAEHADLDLVILDLNLLDRDGFSVLSKLRESHPAISVVVMSAQQDHDSVVKAPSALAVLRLRTISNLVGNCTGRSPGFSRHRVVS